MPLTKEEIRSLLSDIENERVERTLSTDNTKTNSCVHTRDFAIPEQYFHRPL